MTSCQHWIKIVFLFKSYRSERYNNEQQRLPGKRESRHESTGMNKKIKCQRLDICHEICISLSSFISAKTFSDYSEVYIWNCSDQKHLTMPVLLFRNEERKQKYAKMQFYDVQCIFKTFISLNMILQYINLFHFLFPLFFLVIFKLGNLIHSFIKHKLFFSDYFNIFVLYICCM